LTEYIISAIAVSLIGAIALHLAHRELLPPVKMAVGLVLLSFVILPIGSFFRSLTELELPAFDSGEAFGGSFESATGDAFSLGIALALAEEFGVPAECFSVREEGFSYESLSAERVLVVMSGSAALLDYRRVEDYIEENLEVGDAVCEIEIG